MTRALVGVNYEVGVVVGVVGTKGGYTGSSNGKGLPPTTRAISGGSFRVRVHTSTDCEI